MGLRVCFCPGTFVRHLHRKFQDLEEDLRKDGTKARIPTSKWVHGYENGSNVGVYLPVCPPFLQILVYTVIADLGQQRHVRDANLLLLEALFPVCLLEMRRCWRVMSIGCHTLATLVVGPPDFLAGTTFFPAFFDGAW